MICDWKNRELLNIKLQNRPNFINKDINDFYQFLMLPVVEKLILGAFSHDQLETLPTPFVCLQ